MRPRVLLVDHVDSFTYNLVQAFRESGADVLVRRHDELSIDDARALAPSHLVLSPGPGHPAAMRTSLALIDVFRDLVPILGVCLGHQCLGLAAGADVVRAARPEHGKTVRVYHDGRAPFRGLANPFVAGRYNSLVVEESSLVRPDSAFEVSAWSADGEVLGLRHRRLPVLGLQFHPESVLTPDGHRILSSFLAFSRATAELRS